MVVLMIILRGNLFPTHNLHRFHKCHLVVFDLRIEKVKLNKIEHISNYMPKNQVAEAHKYRWALSK